MPNKKAFALRVDERVLIAVRRWADDELRSVNAQIEYVLREALRKAGRLPKDEPGPAAGPVQESDTDSH